MQLFLIFAIPVSYLYFLTITGQTTASPSILSRSVAKGAAFSIVALAGVALVNRFASVSESGFVYYFVTTLQDLWLPTVLLFGLYSLTLRGLGDLPPSERQTALRSFLVGGLTVLSLSDLFLYAGSYSSYHLFLLPTVRIAIILAVPAVFYLYSSIITWYRYLVLVGLLALPFAYGVAFWLHAANLGIWSSLATLLMFAGSAAAAIFAEGGVRALRV